MNYPQYYMPQNQIVWPVAQPQIENIDLNRLVWIQGGKNSALAYMLAPNQTKAYLMDQDEPYLYYKTIVNGRPHLQTFKLVEEIDSADVEVDSSTETSKDDLSKFITKDDLSELLKEIQNIKDEILDIQTTPGDEVTPKTNNKKGGK